MFSFVVSIMSDESDKELCDNLEYLCPSTPKEIVDAAQRNILQVLPAKSKEKYMKVRDNFLNWRKQKSCNSFSENVLFVYFEELSVNKKSSSLWSIYSMLRSTLQLLDNVDISKYSKLISFLKRKNEGYVPKQSMVLTNEDVKKFINAASDYEYLHLKAIAVIGISGGLRREEIYNIRMNDLSDKQGSVLIVTVPVNKSNKPKTFAVSDTFYDVYKSYLALRPKNATSDKFFLKFSKGKCFNQNLGINKIGDAPKEIAKFLNLPNIHLYTGHSFRRSGATCLVNTGASVNTLKDYGQWRSFGSMQRYYESNEVNKVNISKTICNEIMNGPDNDNTSRQLSVTHTVTSADTSGTSECLLPSNRQDPGNNDYLVLNNKQDSDLLPTNKQDLLSNVFNNCTFSNCTIVLNKDV